MNKKLILSLSAAALLCNNLDAQSMLERFEAMEREMNALKQEIAELKSKPVSLTKNLDDSDEEDDSDEKIDLASEKDDDEDEGKDAENEGDEAEDADEFDIEEEIADIQENLSELNKATSGSHLKFGVDYRFAMENLQYKMADGSKAKNDALLTNRLWINLGWKANSNLSFKGQLAYNKTFGQRSAASTPANSSLEGFDWISNENAYGDSLRVRSAYFYYHNRTFLGTDIPWTFSIGRRPSTGGKLINLRDDDTATSPLAHAINVEFDGLSSKFSFDEWVKGMYVKLCAGRGQSNAAPRFNNTPYSQDESANPSIDMLGLIFSPYDDKQYSVTTQYYYANNLIDLINPNDQTGGFNTVGGIHSASANFTAKGIGNGWSDFLDESTFFVSAAMSKTDPKAGDSMLGSTKSETGTSYWIGTQFPSLLSEDGKMGFEYNHGSKYWRSITYGEDTNIGSKIAARGNAYEAYFTEYLVDEILSLQLRYTYIDYDYSGSNGFFGSTTGTPMTMDAARTAGQGGAVVDKAQDIRLYLRYKY